MLFFLVIVLPSLGFTYTLHKVKVGMFYKYIL